MGFLRPDGGANVTDASPAAARRVRAVTAELALALDAILPPDVQTDADFRAWVQARITTAADVRTFVIQLVQMLVDVGRPR